MDVCNLGRTEMILSMPWLTAHNPEINWEMEEVKMTRCPLLYGNKVEITKRVEKEKRRIQTNKLRRVDKRDEDDWEWSVKDKFDKEEILDREKIERIVPKQFHR